MVLPSPTQDTIIINKSKREYEYVSDHRPIVTGPLDMDSTSSLSSLTETGENEGSGGPYKAPISVLPEIRAVYAIKAIN